ncbi:MAG: CheF family chemotaxis protein [Methanomicrobiales archaeon]|nr:CheF family chemotaxis protein [Methanomicrobiales archaeon]MDI6877328.1 CheF family chemotaxis protein [Methanomicrobiales archaeon]
MQKLPVKLEHDGGWVVSSVGLDGEALSIGAPLGREIPYKSIVDVQERKSLLSVTLKDGTTLKIASVEKVLQILKRRITVSCSAYRLMAYFMSPAIRGGVLVTNARWEKGAVAVLKSGIWFVSQEKQVCVPLTEVASIELTQREVQGKQTDVIKLDHLERNEVITSFVLCPLSTLQVLYNFLKDATREMDMRGDELDPLSAQVAMLVYSGMDSHAIENMLSISQKQLEAVFDRLIGLEIAQVVCVRREVQLTPKGVRYISDAVKNPDKK